MQLGRLVLDPSLLRVNRDFRWLYVGRSASILGSVLTEVAISWQVYEVSRHSTLDVGLVSLVWALATVAGLLYGGELADRLDRRQVLQAVRVPQALLVGALAVYSLGGRPALWTLFAFVLALGVLGGLGAPSSSASVPNIVGIERMTSAAALNGLSYQTAGLAGPALAGLLIAGPGISWCYALDAASFLLFALSVSRLPPMPGPKDLRRATGLSAIADGVRFVRRHKILAGILLVDANAMVFGLPEALFPALAIHHFHGGSVTFGILSAGPALGAVIGAACSGWTGSTRQPGLVIIAATVVWGAAMIGFGIIDELAIGVALLALAGAADIFSEVLRSALLQAYTPDAMRGRVTALWLAQTNAAPGLGNAEAGAAAALVGLTGAVVSGGALCIAGALALAAATPSLRRANLAGNTSEPDATKDGMSSAAWPLGEGGRPAVSNDIR